MAPLDSATMSETIAKFMLISQERALDQKINSFQETITTLQERYNQETKALHATIARQQDRHEEETKSTREAIVHIQDRYKEETKALHDAITSLQDRHDEYDVGISSLQETVKSLHSFAEQAEAVQIKLQNENAELRAQLSHAEGLTKKAEPSRTRHQGERSRRPHEPRQTIVQPPEPPQRQSQRSKFFEDTNEEKSLPQHEAEKKPQLSLSSGHGHDGAQQQNRPLERRYPRGVKRAHVEDADEPPRRAIPAQEANDNRESRQPRRPTMSKDRSDHTRAHDDEVTRREEKRQLQAEDRAAARKKEFVDYFKSFRDERKAENHGRDQRAFICRFIDGIKDPVLSRWFQEALKGRFPEKTHDEKRSARKAGGRIVGPTRDLTWKDIETVLKHTLWPSMTDWSSQDQESDDMTAQEK